MHSKISGRTVGLFLAGWLVCSNAWPDQAGRIQFVTGSVKLTTAAGATSILQKGDAVSEGDTLVSGKSSSAQIKMKDGGFIAVRPDTQLKIDSFIFNGTEDGSEKGFFSLLRGGFRAITGLIGHVNKQSYRITTPTATIGVRGTDHETMVLTPDNPLVLSGAAESGTYNKVNVGETILTTSVGVISVLSNRMGFAPGMDQLPKVASVDPIIFNLAPPIMQGADGSQKGAGPSEGDGKKGHRGGDTKASLNPDQPSDEPLKPDGPPAPPPPCDPCILPPPPPPPPCEGCLVLPPPPPPPPPPGTVQAIQGVLAVVYCDPPCVNGFADELQGGVADGNGALIAFKTIGGKSGSLGANASIPQQGKMLLPNGGKLNWGEWVGQSTITGPVGFTGTNINRPIGRLHYIGGDAPTMMPTSGVINYVRVGGTAPTDEKFNVGKFMGASISVNFGTNQVNLTNLTIGMNTKTFTMAGTAPSAFNPTTGILSVGTLTGTCAPTCGSPSASGNYTGALVGPGASGLGLAYQISGSTVAGSTENIVGVQGFSK